MAKATIAKTGATSPTVPPVAASQTPVQEAHTSAPWVPPTDTVGAAAGPAYKPGDVPHQLGWHPGAYMLMDGRVIPALSPVPITPGVEGVGDAWHSGRQRYVATYENQRDLVLRRGMVLVPVDIDAADGHPSYLKTVPGTGTVCHRLQTLVPGAPPQAPAPHIYAEWVESLYDRTPVRRPTDYDVDKVMAQHRRIEDIVSGSTSAADQLAGLRKRHVAPASA
jgi:hypothetical protein